VLPRTVVFLLNLTLLVFRGGKCGCLFSVSSIACRLACVTCATVGRDESFDSLARHDTTTLQRAVMSPVQMPRPQQQQQLTSLCRQAPDSNVTRYTKITDYRLHFELLYFRRISLLFLTVIDYIYTVSYEKQFFDLGV